MAKETQKITDMNMSEKLQKEGWIVTAITVENGKKVHALEKEKPDEKKK